jgi:predicted sulfurtransferase
MNSNYNKELKSAFALVIVSFLLFSCFGVVQARSKQGDGIKRVNVEELRTMMRKGTVVVIDVRDAESYKSGHIKGAISITGDKIAEKAKELPRNKMIVTYCS